MLKSKLFITLAICARAADAINTSAVAAPAFAWGQDPVRGVNIGGWLVTKWNTAEDRLVLEPWITPSMFEHKPDWVVDEWTYGAYMSTQNDSVSEIRRHWESWFTVSELEK